MLSSFFLIGQHAVITVHLVQVDLKQALVIREKSKRESRGMKNLFPVGTLFQRYILVEKRSGRRQHNIMSYQRCLTNVSSTSINQRQVNVVLQTFIQRRLTNVVFTLNNSR